MKKVTKESIIEKSEALYGKNTFDYSLLVYNNNNKEKLTFICKKHNQEFKQTTGNHYYGYTGCPICKTEKLHNHKKLKTTEQFISECKKIHNDKYDYSLVEYYNWKTKVKIICPYHGEFEQNPLSHKQGTGCPTCSRSSVSRKGGLTNVQDIQNQSVILYFCEFQNEQYHFVKIGLTSRTVDLRFKPKKYSVYERADIVTYKLKAINAIQLESDILEKFKEFKYHISSKDSFKGCTELFNIKAKDKILDYLESKISSIDE